MCVRVWVSVFVFCCVCGVVLCFVVLLFMRVFVLVSVVCVDLLAFMFLCFY